MKTVHAEVIADNVEALKVALAHPDVQIDATNSGDFTALMLAVWYGNTKCAELLIEQHANVNHETRNGDTALIYAIMRDRRDLVRMLIKAGANLDQKYKGSETMQEYARARGRDEIVEILRDADKESVAALSRQSLQAPQRDIAAKKAGHQGI